MASKVFTSHKVNHLRKPIRHDHNKIHVPRCFWEIQNKIHAQIFQIVSGMDKGEYKPAFCANSLADWQVGHL